MRWRRDVAVVVGICAIVLVLGALGKACRGFWHDPSALVCHSDIRALYPVREMDRDLFPYVRGDLIVRPRPDRPWPPFEVLPVDGANEYPVLTGVLMWFPSLLTDDPDAYLLASVVLLAPFGLATAWLLGRLVGRRALLWSASPILVLYAFHNWDLAVVAASVAGWWCWWRGRSPAAAVCFGVGGALKLYPLLFLLPLALDALRAGDQRDAVRVGAAGIGTFALINLPFVVLSPSGWAVAYRFQSLHWPNHDSLWGVLARTFDLDLPAINAWSTVATFAVFGALTLVILRRAGREDRYPFLPACAALLAGFLLVGKVHSPQYALWLIPLFALVRIRFVWYALFVAGNVVMYLAIFGASAWSIHARDVVVTWSVWARTATLLCIVLAFLRAPAPVPLAVPGVGSGPKSSRAD